MFPIAKNTSNHSTNRCDELVPLHSQLASTFEIKLFPVKITTWHIITTQKYFTFQTGFSHVIWPQIGLLAQSFVHQNFILEHSQEKRAVLPHFCIPKVPELKPHESLLFALICSSIFIIILTKNIQINRHTALQSAHKNIFFKNYFNSHTQHS